MRPFSPRNYKTPVLYFPRVVVREDADEEDTWPGDGTLLRCNAGQSKPRDRFTHQVEETTTAWELWFNYQAVVDAEVVMRRGDQFRIAQAYGPEIVLRATAHMVDWNQSHVDWYVGAEEVN